MSDRDATTDEHPPLADPASALTDAAPEPADPAEDPAIWSRPAAGSNPSHQGEHPVTTAEQPDPDGSPAGVETSDGGSGTDGGSGAGERRLRTASPELPGSAGSRDKRRKGGTGVGPRVSYRRPQGQRDRGASGTPAKNLILGIVAFVLVAGVAIIFAMRSGGTDSAAPRATAPAAVSPVSYRYTMVEPAQVGGWTKLDDQSPVEQFRTEVAESGVQKPFAVIYTDQTSDSAIAWGGLGTPYAKGTQESRLDAFFVTASRNVGGGSAGPRQSVEPGALGGTAECATVAGVGISMVVCGWTGDSALLGFEFSGGTIDTDLPQMQSMLAAIVQPAQNH